MMSNETAYIERTTKWTAIVVAGLLIFSIPLTLLRNVPFYYVSIVLTCTVAIPFFLSVEKLICFFLFYIIAFEIPLFRGNLYPLSMSYFVVDLGMLALFLLVIGEYCIGKIRTEKSSHYFSLPFLIFFIVVSLSFLVGLSHKNNLHIMLREISILSYYAVYFIAVKYFQDTKWIKFLLLTVLLSTVMASFDAIFTYISLPIVRFVSRQVHIFLLVTPFLISLMILDKNLLRKISYFIILIPIEISIIISQTRGTWVSILIAVILAVFLSLHSSTKDKSRILTFIVVISTFGVIIAFSLKFIGRISKAKTEFVETRVESISNLQTDYSLYMRTSSYLTIAKKIKEHPWFGNGLGDTATYLFFGQYSTQNNVDSTYLTILWKMGVVGLIAFLTLYFSLLRRALFIYRKAEDIFLKTFSIGIISAFVALLILGIISPVLITYRFNFLFGVLFAVTETISKKV